MSLDADQIVDRRRMRRKLTFWRVFAVLIALVAIAVVAFRFSGRDSLLAQATGHTIARVTIKGLIRNDVDRVESLDRLADSRVGAVIVHIDSPGGTTSGAEQLFGSLRAVAAKKPMVVVIDGLAASGGYIAAMASDHIIAQQSSLVGSIGVLFQYPNVGDLLKTVGVKIEEIKSSPLKAAPNGYEPTSPEARAAIEAVVMDSYAWFRRLVQERRRIEDGLLEKVADGRIFTGRQGLEMKLVDQLGGEEQAIAWLAKEKKVDPKWPVRDWRLSSRLGDLPFLHLGMRTLFDAVGLGAIGRHLENTAAIQAIERLNLDGLLALWHPSAN